MNTLDSSYWVTDDRKSDPDGSINAESGSFSDITILADPPQGFYRLYRAKRYGKFHILKVLKPDYAQNPLYWELIRKEFDIGYSLDHPNIRKTISFEYIPEVCSTLYEGSDKTQNRPAAAGCIVLEYVDGLPLSELIAHNSLSYSQKHKILNQVCDALAYVHAKQIIHRDLKPDNILVTSNGCNAKIIDFGLSDTDDYCELKAPAGSRDYASPEQKAGQPLDCRSDIYSLGLIISDLTNLYPKTVAKCTKPNREERFASVADVVNAARSEVGTRHTIILTSAICAAIVLGLALTWLIRNANKPDFSTVHDLTADGRYANCYVVSKPGRYKFATTLVDGTPLEHGDIAHWYWQSPEILLENIVYGGNYISFTVKKIGKGGNALITFEDSKGIRIWSWHIWVTPYSLNEMNVSLKGHDWLSCNLGATFVASTKDSAAISRISDEELQRTYGLYYQFGRPTPFPGGNVKGRNSENFNTGFSAPSVLNNAYIGRFKLWAFCFDSSITIESALRKPIYAFIRSADQPYPFLFPTSSTSDVTLWGGHAIPESDSLLLHVPPSAGKSDYDPCPPGYRMPNSIELYEDLNPNNAITSTKNSMVVSTSVNGTNSMIVGNNGKFVLIPAAGHITVNPSHVSMVVNVGYDCLYPTSDICCIGTTPRASLSPDLSSSEHQVPSQKPLLYENLAMYFYTRFFTAFSSDFLSLTPIRCVRESPRR